jgi:hypothetical protein
LSLCEHDEVKWLHSKKEQDCGECGRDNDPCSLVVCAGCGDEMLGELTDAQQRFLQETA